VIERPAATSRQMSGLLRQPQLASVPVTLSGAEGATLGVRMRGIPEIVDGDWVPLLLAGLGYDTAQRNCLVLSLAGADLTRPLTAVLTELSAQLHVPFTVLLDGDKQDQYRDNPNVCFLPVADLEELFLQDPQAVHDGLLSALTEENPERAKAVEAQWSPDAVATYLAQHRHPQTKAAELLTGLARRMGTTYRKPVVAPLIAERLSAHAIEQLRPVLMPRLDPEEGSTELNAADPDASTGH
jgi:hypothetical protein